MPGRPSAFKVQKTERWGYDPIMHLCAGTLDLARLNSPRRGFGVRERIGKKDCAGGCRARFFDAGRQLRQLQSCRKIKGDKRFCMESWRLPAS
jgi:hypothetical protein